MLRETILGRRLATLAGQERLDPVQIARLGVLAALHDAGKANVGFQNKAFDHTFTAGHLSEIVDLLFAERPYLEQQHLWEAMAVEELAGWAPGEGTAELLLATFGHHGRPVIAGPTVDIRCWTPTRGLDPFQKIAQLVSLTRDWFPEAWDP
jgi:CRISPR-associated endonuclease/helicase Cas3